MTRSEAVARVANGPTVDGRRGGRPPGELLRPMRRREENLLYRNYGGASVSITVHKIQQLFVNMIYMRFFF